MRYRFDVALEGAVYVPPQSLYQRSKTEDGQRLRKREAERLQCGFLTEENRAKDERLSIPELNSGFDTVCRYRGRPITHICADTHGCFVDWQGEGELPLTFAADVPGEGNYRVKVVLYAQEPAETKIFLGRRRLAWMGVIGGTDGSSGGLWEGGFVTNICPVIPRTYTKPMEDLTLDVTVLGVGVHLLEVAVESWEGRTIYIAGDSTVTDQSAEYPYLPGCSYCGWGQMLSAYSGECFAVSNHAHSGLTTESFRSEGHYKILYDRIKEGDICLFQFGHNDQKLMHLKAEGGYRENLLRYIQEIRKKGASPVLVTPLARNSWRGDDGTYNDLLAHYAAVCAQLAKEVGILLCDLHQKSMAFVKRCGRERAMWYFYPSDYTHMNDYGAYRSAGYVWEALAREETLVQKQAVNVHRREWEPSGKPVLPTVAKDCGAGIHPAQERLFEKLERPDEDLTRVEALEMVIATMHFFPTNVYNDMFSDIVGHEIYAGTVECAWQNGLIPESMICEGKFFPQKKITGGEFLQILRNGYQSRKTWTKELEETLTAGCPPESSLKRGMAAEMCKRSAI